MSSSSPNLNYLSFGVLAVMEGLPLTSINQGSSLESSKMSKPYSSKELFLSDAITF